MPDALVQFALKAVIVARDRVLVVRKSPDDEHQPGRWELPGGRLKAGETPDDALVREVREEVGLEVVPGRPLAVWSWRLGDGPDAPTVVAVARECTVADDSAPEAVSGEHDCAAWVRIADVLALDLIPGARGPIAEALANLDTPDVDGFEVVAERDTLLVACPDLPCEVRHVVAKDWLATVGEIIRVARGHEHRYPTQGQEASHA